MLNKIKLYWTFYKSTVWSTYGVAFVVACTTLGNRPSMSYFIKVFALGLIIGTLISFGSKMYFNKMEFHFYYNCHLGKTQLLTMCLLVNLITAIILTAIS